MEIAGYNYFWAQVVILGLILLLSWNRRHSLRRSSVLRFWLCLVVAVVLCPTIWETHDRWYLMPAWVFIATDLRDLRLFWNEQDLLLILIGVAPVLIVSALICAVVEYVFERHAQAS